MTKPKTPEWLEIGRTSFPFTDEDDKEGEGDSGYSSKQQTGQQFISTDHNDCYNRDNRYSYRPKTLNDNEFYDHQRRIRFSPEKTIPSSNTPNMLTDYEIPSRIKTNSPISPCSQMTSPTRIMMSPTDDSDDTEDPLELKNNYTNITEPTTPTTINIEHNVKNKDTSKMAKARKFIKPIIATVVVLMTGSAAYLMSEFFTIPGLKSQVDRLEEQNTILKNQITKLERQIEVLGIEVNELELQVNRLENETEKLSLVNESLNQTAMEYIAQNDRLNTSLILFQELNDDLNNAVANLTEYNLDLEASLEEYFEINQALAKNISELSVQVEQLEQNNEDLAESNENLEANVVNLQNENEMLSNSTAELSSTVEELKDSIFNATNEVDRLKNLTSDLAIMVSFLNETSFEIDSTVESVVAGVAEQITVSREIAMQTLKNSYQSRTSFWDCDFRENFLMESFVEDRNSPIGSNSYPGVLTYIDGRVLTYLCLEEINFELYLTQQINSTEPSDVTFNEIQRAVGRYTDEAMEYYFSSGTIDAETWAEAKFDCDYLPPSATYTYYTTSVQ